MRVEAVYQGAGQAAVNPIPPTMWSWNKDVPAEKYDVEAAKKVLADAGLKEIQLWASDRVRPYNPNFQRAAEHYRRGEFDQALQLELEPARVFEELRVAVEAWRRHVDKLHEHEAALLMLQSQHVARHHD